MPDLANIVPWWGYSLLFSLLWPINIEANRHFQVDGQVLIVWRALACGLLLLPAALFAPWPTSPYFYFFLAVSALLFSYQECEAFKLSKIYGGLFLTLQSVLWILTATILWWVIDPDSLKALMSHPLSSGFVLCGILLGVSAQFFLRSGKVGFYTKDLNKILFMGVVGGTAVTCVKLGMSYTDTFLSVFVWNALNNLLIGVFNSMRYGLTRRRHNIPPLAEAKSIKAGIFMGFIMALCAPLIVLSLAAAPNPGFSNMVAQLSSVWLYLYCRWAHKPINVHLLGLVLTVAAALFLIMGTSLFH
ncbi:MAG: hypothetical protein DI551_07590 [Micavibrio aeruginosavorus]|uniref:EamA domain-containing protein n=1 Tax=Micavibrio aeruginosavorus TaxID=349221 RepID=A0A2W5MYW7_9BACT|nr:MAG: hypothetical protein DI551_07590 [Micavibrio aeruginosavorus]